MIPIPAYIGRPGSTDPRSIVIDLMKSGDKLLETNPECFCLDHVFKHCDCWKCQNRLDITR